MITILMVIWLNGEMLDAAEARLAASSAGVLLGWGIFTTLGIWGGRAFAVKRHIVRLRRDAAAVDVPIAFSDETIEGALQDVITRNAASTGYARLTATRRGDGRWNDRGGGDLSIMTVAWAKTTARGAGQVLRLGLSPYRLEARRATAGIKTTSYLDHQLAWREANNRGFDEAVLCNGQGIICECARANLFWTSRNQLCTPALESGCLPGIGREIVLEWAREMGLPTREGAFSLQELARADEVFVTAATTGPRPVRTFYDACDESGIEHSYNAPGPLTQLLQKRWDEAVSR